MTEWNPSDPYQRPRGRNQQWGNPWAALGPQIANAFGPAGPPPWLGEMFGVPPQQRPHRGPRVRRGDVRTAIIDVLHRAGRADETINGYQVIQQIAALSHDEWRPSPGSVYPTISQLEDEGLVESDETRGRRSLRLTAQGIAWAEANVTALSDVWAPFQSTDARDADPAARAQETRASDPHSADFKSEITQVLSAAWQLVTQGSAQQRRDALDVLSETRRSLYQILAEGRGGPRR